MQYGLRGGYMTAAALGAAFAVIFLTYALGWWLGGYLISHGDDQMQTVGDVTNVFFSVMMGSMAMAQIAPSVTAILEARGAMQSIVKIIKREPKIGMRRHGNRWVSAVCWSPQTNCLCTLPYSA